MTMLSRFATLGGGPPDPYFANVSFLLVGNGVNGTNTNIIDSSNNHFTITNVGSVVISSAQSKFGGSSVLLNGTSQYLTCASNTAFVFGTGDYTVEGWVYQSANNAYSSFVEVGDHQLATGAIYLVNNASVRNATVYSGGFFNSEALPSTGQWYYVAYVRSSGVLRIYVNGTSTSATAFTNNLTASSFTVGYTQSSIANSGYLLNGYVYDVRVTKGVARYTGSTMTVPTAPLPTYGP
jgi:hypothetical protein